MIAMMKVSEEEEEEESESESEDEEEEEEAYGIRLARRVANDFRRSWNGRQ